MIRAVVYRTEGSSRINVNDEIGLDPYMSYTVQEHLEDLAHYEDRHLERSLRDLFVFGDGEAMILVQGVERIGVEGLDGETQSALLWNAAMRSPFVAQCRPDLAVC